MIFDAKDISGNITLEADVVVVGSGAGGGPFAYKMAQAGKRVIILEAGGYNTSKEFTENEAEMVNKLYAAGGGQSTEDGSIGIYQGQTTGGSTVVNGMMCFPPPDQVLHKWANEHGVTGMGPGDLQPALREVEEIINVHDALPHEINRANRLFIEGCHNLGWQGAPARRNTKECLATGFCLAGCAYDRKRSVLVTYIPLALEYGATLYCGARVDKVLANNGKVSGVVAQLRDGKSGKLCGTIEVNAKIVALAAGSIQTPCILQRSSLANSSGMVRRNLAIHPAAPMVGLFKEKIYAWRGSVCGGYSDEFAADDRGGYLLESGSLGPALTGMLVPGFGREFQDGMALYPHMASCNSIVHDPGVGEVRYDSGKGRAVINYRPTEETYSRVKDSIKRMAQLWFAAGAKKVFAPFTEPLVLEGPEQLSRIDERPMLPNSVILNSYHPQGTAKMGSDPTSSVIAFNGESHDIENLFVVDASSFPTSIEVNPQITTMMLGTHFAQGILAESSRYFS